MSWFADAPFDSFWDRSYRDGSYLEHWDPPGVPAELAALAALPPGSGGIPAGATVLDVGCGAGTEAVYLAGLGFRVIGVDSSRKALERARKRERAAGVEVDWRAGSVYALPVDDGSADLVLDRGCLHCLDREDRSDYARETGRVLAPGGRLLVRGAREDDEEEGVVGIGAAELDRLFPAPPEGRFERGPVVPFELRSRTGVLPSVMVFILRAPSPAAPRIDTS